MRLSKNFLSDYLDIKNIPFSEVAEKMLLVGNEYDEYKKLCDGKNILVGQVVSCQKHPESNKLSICRVDTGNETNQIVCGALNVAKDQKVVVVLPGSLLPGNIEIKKAKLAGVESNGMICSLAELGLDKKFLKESDYEEILVLDKSAKIGEDAIKYLGFDDEIIDFDLTANRGDLLSVLGMAYEIGAIYNLKVKYPKFDYTESNISIKDKYKLDIKTDNCMLYLAKLVNNLKIAESPNFIKSRLIASGIRPINNVVDISNYVMLETGQPIHFFDADKVKKLGVRMGNDEEIQTLDSQIRVATKEDIVITSDDNVIALAGVMGGLATEVTEETKNIIIESAIFNSSNIRNTSKKTLRSEASIRFEKGLPKERTYMAIKSACVLLEKYANGSIAKDLLVHDKLKIAETTIKINQEQVNNLLGTNLEIAKITEIFNRLQLPYCLNKEIEVLVPERRGDLKITEDLIEEVGRLIGYDNIKSELPVLALENGKYDNYLKWLKNIKTYMVGLGLNETINYSLTNKNNTEMFGDFQTINIKEPISVEREYLRTSLIPSLLNTYSYNHARKINDVNIFEIGAIYYKEAKTYIEDNHLAVLMSGKMVENKWQKINIEVDFYVLKGVLELLLTYLGFNNRYQIKQQTIANLHPNRSGLILLGTDEIGVIGQVHPKIANDVYVFAIDLEKLFMATIKPIKYKEPMRFPSIKKDLAFVVDNKISSLTIEKSIKKIGSRMLEKIEVFDVYQIDENKKSIAYSLTFSDAKRTLNEEEIMVILNKIINEIEKEFNAKLRSN